MGAGVGIEKLSANIAPANGGFTVLLASELLKLRR